MNPKVYVDLIKSYFERNPVKKFYAIWGLVFAGILIIDHMILKPIIVSLKDVKVKLASLSNDKTRLKILNITNENRESRYKELVLDLRLARTEYIKEKELPSLISQISTLARQNKTDLKKTLILNTADLTGESPGRSLPFQLEASGHYIDFSNSIRVIEDKVDPFFTWDVIQIRDMPGKDGQVSVLIVMSFYERQGL